jgi:glycosyltransferase involved in cell wall biosynthesis
MNTEVSIIIPNLNPPVIPQVLEAVRKQTTDLRLGSKRIRQQMPASW